MTKINREQLRDLILKEISTSNQKDLDSNTMTEADMLSRLPDDPAGSPGDASWLGPGAAGGPVRAVLPELDKLSNEIDRLRTHVDGIRTMVLDLSRAIIDIGEALEQEGIELKEPHLASARERRARLRKHFGRE